MIEEKTEVSKEAAYENIVSILRRKVHLYPCVIICNTKKSVDRLYDKLLKNNYNVVKYHASMTETDQQLSFTKFVKNIAQIFVTTGCSKLSIKQDIRFLIHNNMPFGIYRYIKDIELLGKDGGLSCSYLFWSEEDINLAEFIFSKNNLDRADLYAMVEYCREATYPEDFLRDYLEGKWSIKHQDNYYKSKRRYCKVSYPLADRTTSTKDYTTKDSYIREKMFGGLGSPSDESQTWSYVAAQLRNDSEWVPESHCGGGLPSDEEDEEWEAYYALSERY